MAILEFLGIIMGASVMILIASAALVAAAALVRMFWRS